MSTFPKFVLLAAFAVMLLGGSDARFMVGGMGEEKPATKEIKQMALKMKGSAEELLNREFQKFEAKSFATQVVAGTNYFIKVQVDGGEYVHLRVFKPLPFIGSGPKLSNAIDGKAEVDVLKYIPQA